MWFTLTPESARLGPRTILQILTVIKAIKVHARLFWRYNEEQMDAIALRKIDSAIDFKGSFLPDPENPPYDEI